MENKILLLDDLGKKYGETHIYHNLKTPAEALKLLCINYPELAKDVLELQEQGIFYKVQQVDIDLELSDLFLPLGSHDLVVTPVISGSGDVGKFVLGGLMISIGIFSGGTGFALGVGGFGFTGTSLAASIANLGVAMVLGGISDLLSPQPTPQSIDSDGAFSSFTGGPASVQRGADGTQTFAYTGPTNVTGLGKTIPVVYGKALTGSLIVGADIKPENTGRSNIEYFREPGVDTFTINGDPLTNGFSDHGGITAKALEKRKGQFGSTNFGFTPYRSSTPRYGGGGRRQPLSGNHRTSGGSREIKLEKDTEQNQHNNTFNSQGVAYTNFNALKSGGKSTKNTRICFEISGLIDRVGDENSTFIDGFITYQIIIRHSSSRVVAGKHQITIQGLLKKTQIVRYILQIPFAHLDHNTYKLFIKVIDSSVITKDCIFRATWIGQKLK